MGTTVVTNPYDRGAWRGSPGRGAGRSSPPTIVLAQAALAARGRLAATAIRAASNALAKETSARQPGAAT